MTWTSPIRPGEHNGELSSALVILAAKKLTWLDQAANVISGVAAPPVLATSMFIFAAASSQQANSWQWAVAGVSLSVLMPFVYLLWLFRIGLVSDMDVQRREERPRPLLFTLGAMFATVALFWLTSAPPLLRAVALALFVHSVIVFVITLFWKISMHGAAGGASVALVLMIAGNVAAPMVLALPLILWARVRLGRHTPAQAIAGAVVGIAVILWAFRLVVP